MLVRKFALAVLGCTLLMASAQAAIVLDNFTSTGAPNPTRWYISSDSDAVAVQSWGGLGGGQYGLITRNGASLYHNGAGDGDAPLNVAWGPIFTVTDTSKTITFNLAGGNPGNTTWIPVDRRNGAVGVALWDYATHSVVPGTIQARSNNNDFGGGPYTINLTGLSTTTKYGIVVADRSTGGWGWTGVTDIQAPDNGITLSTNTHHQIFTQYDFDTNATTSDGGATWNGSLTGWSSNNANFAVQGADYGGANRWVNLNGVASSTAGFLTSSPSGNEGLTGTITSPTFTVEGDIIEFRVAGGEAGLPGGNFRSGTGSNPLNMGFELVKASDNTVLRWAVGRDGAENEFEWDYWNVTDLQGIDVYFRLRDERSGGWARISVDAIRELGFDIVIPEPASFSMVLAVGLLACRRR